VLVSAHDLILDLVALFTPPTRLRCWRDRLPRHRLNF
jgi:hypothetical protein